MAPKKPKEIAEKDTKEVWKFLLSQIRSQTLRSKGRVAKKRIDPYATDLWKVYIRRKHRRRTPEAYVENFRHYSHRLEGLNVSLEDKVDLYYALELEVPEALRKTFTEKFDVEFNENWVITGSSSLSHWDETHPDSDTEEKRQRNKRFGRQQDRYREWEDGEMWKFVMEKMNKGEDVVENKSQVWKEFRGVSGSKRASTSLANRFSFFLLPNLHRMPFDIQTIAAFYQTLQAPVPESFREKLIAETGVSLSDRWHVVDFPNRPDPLVLQSNPLRSRYGITSKTRASLLRNPWRLFLDDEPFTKEEEHEMWEFLVDFVRNKHGRVVKTAKKINGYFIWKSFLENSTSNRTWQSLAVHFSDNLVDNIMDADIDILTKIEIYFVLNKPVNKELLKIFRSEACVELTKNRTIGYAGAGPYWRLGNLAACRKAKKRKEQTWDHDSEGSDEEGQEEEEEEEDEDPPRFNWMFDEFDEEDEEDEEGDEEDEELKTPIKLVYEPNTRESSSSSTSSSNSASRRMTVPPQFLRKAGMTFEQLERRREEHIRILKENRWLMAIPPGARNTSPVSMNSVRFPYMQKVTRIRKPATRKYAKKSKPTDVAADKTEKEEICDSRRSISRKVAPEHTASTSACPQEHLYLTDSDDGSSIKNELEDEIEDPKPPPLPLSIGELDYSMRKRALATQKFAQNQRKSMEEVFEEVEENLRIFCRRLKMRSNQMSTTERQKCVSRLEDMARMIRFETKRSLARD